jgi:glycosyltransferase involved in cell wall biosynthesis
MKVAVAVAVYNEEREIGDFLDALARQSRLPDEAVVVDDGSTDGTPAILFDYASRYPWVRVLRQENKGPAAARNLAWKNTSAEIIVFSDGDCVPETDWIVRLLAGFDSNAVGAVAGTYKTLNPDKLLADFVGTEIAWKYRRQPAFVDAHGSYNLAVRRKILEVLGGFKEIYPKPSGEDWDLTYRISREHRIRFLPEAVVGHRHPERLWPYLRGQARRGYDRIRLYLDHPSKIQGDVYTGPLVKYQVLAAASLPFWAVCFAVPVPWLRQLPLAALLVLLAVPLESFLWISRKRRLTAMYGLAVQWLRSLAWGAGVWAGVFAFLRIRRRKHV